MSGYQGEQPAGPAPLPPRGTIAGYTYESAYPTPHERTQLVLVTGSVADEQGNTRVTGIVLGHADEQAEFQAGQLHPLT